MAGLFIGREIVVHYKLKQVLLLMYLLVLPAVGHCGAAAFLSANEISLTPEDKAWIEQQAENLKTLEPLNQNIVIPDAASMLDIADSLVAPNKTSLISPQSPASESSPQLFIFVSLGMPAESLKALAKQAKQAGGTLVLRGLIDNSLKKTLAKVMEILGKEPFSGLNIDPVAFRTFNIHAVPAVVVAASHQTFDVVYGGVTLSYALQKINDEGETALLAKNYLQKLRGTP